METVLKRKVEKIPNPRRMSALETVLRKKAYGTIKEEEIEESIDPKKWSALETVLKRKANLNKKEELKTILNPERWSALEKVLRKKAAKVVSTPKYESESPKKIKRGHNRSQSNLEYSSLIGGSHSYGKDEMVIFESAVHK